MAECDAVRGERAAVEAAAKKGGHEVTVPFTPGRTDATQEQTDVESVRRAGAEWPTASATTSRRRTHVSGHPCELLVDKAQLADADRTQR